MQYELRIVNLIIEENNEQKQIHKNVSDNMKDYASFSIWVNSLGIDYICSLSDKKMKIIKKIVGAKG